MIAMGIPDLHEPHSHPDFLAYTKAVQKRGKPDRIVFLGDVADFHAFSQYPKNTKSEGASKELQLAKKALKKWYKAYPEADVCVSNHDRRPERLAELSGLPKESIVPLETLLEMPEGWNLAWKHTIDGVTYEHGDAYRSGRPGYVLGKAMRSTVYGHWHSQFGIEFQKPDGKDMFAAAVGCGVDPTSWAFSYTRDPKMLGVILVVDGSPILLPMRLKKNGRWDGTVNLP